MTAARLICAPGLPSFCLGAAPCGTHTAGHQFRIRVTALLALRVSRRPLFQVADKSLELRLQQGEILAKYRNKIVKALRLGAVLEGRYGG